MLPVLLEVPRNADDWTRWAFHNQEQINLLMDAIREQYGVNLTGYILFPINTDSPDQWLFNNQAAHNDINGVLGLQGHNVQDLDFSDPAATTAWINLNYQEIYDASIFLGVS